MTEYSPQIRKVAVVAGNRIPFARQDKTYRHASNSDMLTAAIDGLVDRTGIAGEELGEVVAGAVLKHSRDWNLVREVVLGSKLAPATPAYDLQQACGTGLEAAILAGNKIALGQTEVAIAGGVDTASDAPISLNDNLRNKLLDVNRARTAADRLKALSRIRPKDIVPEIPRNAEPRTGLSMGEHCALTTLEWGVTREEQDELAYRSHKNLAPVFGKGETATMTAGNSTPLTDGASAVLLSTDEWARAHGLQPLAYLTHSQTAAVDYVKGNDGLLMAPAYAVPRMLARAGLTLQDFDYYEIHEAFAAQVLATLKAWEDPIFCKERLGLDAPLGEIDRDKLNVNGGSLAAGHPFAATGGRILAGLAKQLNEAGGGRGLISICAAGGQGVVAIVEK